jgi:hypothetical protein
MEHNITAPLSKHGLTEYFKDFLGGETGTASAEVLADLTLLAASEEREACAATVEQIAGAWAKANGIHDYPMMNEIAVTIRRRRDWFPHDVSVASAVNGDPSDTKQMSGASSKNSI